MFKTVKMIDVNDWDALVMNTYNKTYSFQQQDGCKDRGAHELTIPTDGYDFSNTTIEEVVNSGMMGVSFKAWMGRSPAQKLEGCEYEWETTIWWERNFYPCIDMIANDLLARGLLEAGEYIINIDW
jgi:hypothetical protein